METARGAHTKRPRLHSISVFGTLAVCLLCAFVLAVVIAPAATLLWSSVMATGSFSLGSYLDIFKGHGYRKSVVSSVLLAATTATIGTAAGGLLAWNLHRMVGERFRSAMLSLATVATNAGGLPLVFGMILLFGSQGAITLILKALFGSAPYELVSFWGLVLVYLYFLVPLCILTFLPSLEAVRTELREAAAVHGARPMQFWIHVGGPILMPPLVASFVLLFVNSFGSFTTPWALIGGGSGLSLITLQVAFLFGEAGYDPQAADALASIIIVIAAACVVTYHLLMRRVAQWSR
jgi:putative spermidine/putrescine transport system permease protein